jgi:hypothetical protein
MKSKFHFTKIVLVIPNYGKFDWASIAFWTCHKIVPLDMVKGIKRKENLECK